jgi:serine/threonine-protein kinase
MMSTMGPNSAGPPATGGDDLGVCTGQIIAGRYRVDGVLGVGGMGVVVAATHVHLDDRVALKLPLPATLGDPSAVARFIEEARAASRIKSGHVARVLDVGTLENGSPYIVMECLQGIDLSVRLQQHGPLAALEAVDLVLQACEALAQVHALGMVHRDVKPSNLFCSQEADGRPFVKLLDFGISTPLASTGGDAIALPEGAVLGSPHYMSPEQLRTPAEVDHRTDIWSLGVVLYELLAGRTPFEAPSIAKLVRAVEGPPPSLCAARRDVSPALDHVVARCLEADRGRRFASIRELAVALADFASEHGRASVERLLMRQEQPSLTGFELGPPASLAPSELPGPVGSHLLGPARRWPTVRAAMWIAAAATLCGLAGTLALVARPSATANAPAGVVPAPASPGGPPAVTAAVADSVAIPTVSVTDLPVARARPALVPRVAGSQVRAAVAASAAAACDPPYVIDETGITRFKPECFATK